MKEDVLEKAWYITVRAEVVTSDQRAAVKKGLERILPLRNKEKLLVQELAKVHPNYQWYMEEGPRYNMPPDEFVRVFIEKGCVILSDGNQRRTCPRCGYPNIFDNPFCNACGADTFEQPRPPSPRYPCPKCGYLNDTRNYHCDKCGLALREIDAPPPAIEDLAKTWYVNIYAAVVTPDKKEAAKKGLERIFSFAEDGKLIEELAKVYPNYEFLTRDGQSHNMQENEFVKAYLVTHEVSEPIECPNHHLNDKLNEICNQCGERLMEEQPPPPIDEQGIKCPNCGAQNITKYKYCHKCGANLLEVNPKEAPPISETKMELKGPPCAICGLETKYSESTSRFYCPRCENEFMKMCPNCNVLNDPKYKYCIKCGTNITVGQNALSS